MTLPVNISSSIVHQNLQQIPDVEVEMRDRHQGESKEGHSNQLLPCSAHVGFLPDLDETLSGASSFINQAFDSAV